MPAMRSRLISSAAIALRDGLAALGSLGSFTMGGRLAWSVAPLRSRVGALAVDDAPHRAGSIGPIAAESMGRSVLPFNVVVQDR
jgi:hypothetical protein